MMVKGHLLRPKERRLSYVVCIKYNNLFHFLKQPSFFELAWLGLRKFGAHHLA